MQPLIFEIGRHEAVLLTDPGDTIHPAKYQVKGGFDFYAKITGIILAGLIFLFFTNSSVNSFIKKLADAKKGYIEITVIGVVLVIALTVGIYLISNQPDEEPFSIFEGISVWPTEIFRLITIVLSVLFIYWSWSSRKENTREINTAFDFHISQKK